jgi:cytidylate kinase
VARALARRLEVPYIDTGAMYRAVGLAAKERGIRLPVADPEEVASIAESIGLELATSPEGSRILLDGRDVSAEIRRPEISLYASAVSAIPAVRRVLVREQQRLGRSRGGVMEGRDIGTHVFPETPHKFFLTASARVRARRRTEELAQRGTPEPYEKVLQEMEKRDQDDGSRADSPLTYDERYVLVDSSDRPVEEVVAEIESKVRKGI